MEASRVRYDQPLFCRINKVDFIFVKANTYMIKSPQLELHQDGTPHTVHGKKSSSELRVPSPELAHVRETFSWPGLGLNWARIGF